MMDDVEIIATFDTEETTRLVAKSLNNWFSWVMESEEDDEIPDFFEDFGIHADEYALDKESDVDWEEIPVARARGNRVIITIDSPNTIDILEELLEGLGAYDVTQSGDED